MRTRICLYVLLLLPLLVYWQTVFSDYGFRDDYRYLRIARDEPGVMVRETASVGRPLYGALLESSYAAIGQVDQLPWMRLASVLLLTVLGVALWRQLYNSGWNEVEGAAIGLGVVLLPSSQIVTGAAACWPQALTLLLAMAGFSAVETEIERGGLKRLVAMIGGCMIYTAAGLIYQSNVLFALVPLTAVYLVRTGREPNPDKKWGAIHLGTLLVGMLLSFVLVKALFSNGVFEQSARMHFETNPFTKLLWFFTHPLPNALALFALADDNFKGWLFYGLSILIVLSLLVYAYRRSLRESDAVGKIRWQVCLFGLPFLASAVSLVAAERAAGYRVIYALAGLVLLLAVHASHAVIANWKIKPRYHHAGLGVIFLGLSITTYWHSSRLIGIPQSQEWDMMSGQVLRANFVKVLRVYIVTPTAEDRTTARIYRDEFGSVTSSSESMAQEMFKAAVRARFPDKLPAGSSFTLATGKTVPEDGKYDLVIDLRKLKSLRGL